MSANGSGGEARTLILGGQGEEKGVCELWWLREEKGDEVSFEGAGYIYP